MDGDARMQCRRGTRADGFVLFAVDPPSALEAIHGWTFRAFDPDLVVGDQQDPPPATWAGVLVHSGQVRVDFRAGGADAIATTFLQIERRSDNQWRQTLSGSIYYSNGTLTFPAGYGDSYMAVLCHHVAGCPR